MALAFKKVNKKSPVFFKIGTGAKTNSSKKFTKVYKGLQIQEFKLVQFEWKLFVFRVSDSSGKPAATSWERGFAADSAAQPPRRLGNPISFYHKL